MSCPLKDKCFWYRVNKDEELLRESCDEDYDRCIYYKICKDSRDVEECTRAIFDYQHRIYAIE